MCIHMLKYSHSYHRSVTVWCCLYIYFTYIAIYVPDIYVTYMWQTCNIYVCYANHYYMSSTSFTFKIQIYIYIQQFYVPYISHIILKFLKILFWLRITDEGSVPEMRIWSILLIKSDLKWYMQFSRSLFLYLTYMSLIVFFFVRVSLSIWSVVNFNLRYNFWTLGDFIFGLHIPLRLYLQIQQRLDDFMTLGVTVAEWLSSWLAEQEVRGSILGLATWISEIVISCFQVAIWLKYHWSDANPQYNQPTSWPWSWPLCWNSFFTDLVTTGGIVFHKHFVLIFCQFCGRYVLIGLSMYFAQGQTLGWDVVSVWNGFIAHEWNLGASSFCHDCVSVCDSSFDKCNSHLGHTFDPKET